MSTYINELEQQNIQVQRLEDLCIHQLFEFQAEKVPNNIAVTFKNQQLTYQELNQQANQLAHYLQKLGVGPDVLVGICLERSLDLIVGLLGILKAGGAYVPLDPAYPQERLVFMLEDSQITVLLTHQHLLSALPETEAQVVCLERDWQIIVQCSQENSTNDVLANNLAYTIYTSGSTGKPKGVQIEHRSVVNLLNSMSRAPGLTHRDIFLAITTVSFDMAVPELYLPLAVGACVTLVCREVASDPAQLMRVLTQLGVTVMQGTPATWRLLLSAGWRGDPSLKILCGGEALTQALAEQLLERSGSVWNMYGPTETTVWSAAYRVEPESHPGLIGQPLDNTQIYLLDSQLQTVALNEIGEVYIGGIGLARGYWNRPELNQAKFVRPPLSTEPAARLYRTGDLARYLPDGSLEFIGRADHQIKIRGFRIELGEIESKLYGHPNVREAVVVAQKHSSDSSDGKRLVAYIVPKPLSASAEPIAPTLPPSEQVLYWQQVWNETYSQPVAPEEPTFNISGIHDSHTGLPTPVDEIRKWLDYTVERILVLQPKRVLEIGCGTGLLLFRIAPHCSRYVGTDISAEAIGYVQQQLDSQQSQAQVTVLAKAADALEATVTETFDVVVINSVIQYFPNLDYLLQVLETAVKVVQPRGHIFIGDVRSLPLLEAFHTSVQLHQAPDFLPIAHLRERIQERVAQDKELVIDPAFFAALKQRFPQINQVQVQLKRGCYHNEFTQFRYDVVLHIGTESLPPVEPLELDWQQQELTLSSLHQVLKDSQPKALKVSQIPNARLLKEMSAMEWLRNYAGSGTVEDLRANLQNKPQLIGIEPEALWSLGQDLGYTTHIQWSERNSTEGYYDVIFQQQSALTVDRHKHKISKVGDRIVSNTSWHTYANNPLQAKGANSLVRQLRSFMQEKLPGYMVPSTFVLLDALPLTPTGKVDRQALPTPSRARPILTEEFIAPHSELEEQLVEIWAQVLGIEQVGTHDNFFELGGDSLLTVQLVCQVKETLQIKLPLLCLFEAPTVAEFAQVIQQHSSSPAALEDQPGPSLEAEAVLDETIVPAAQAADPTAEPRHIFLTGATGFLGAFLLHELLQQTQAKIYCLTRSADPETGRQKIQKNLEHYLLWDQTLSPRIIPVVGNLSQPLLGLTEQQFGQLASEIDLIYHNGALVNLIYPYAALQAPNVSGTQEILRLASQSKTKPVHFVSTLDVFQTAEAYGTKDIQEQDDLAPHKTLGDGYTQTKWVGEKLMTIAKSRGIPVCIYRPGMISGHSQTGISRTDDLICRMIKGFIQLGNAPDLELMLNLIPVDYVSKAIVHLSRQPESLGKAFHLLNPQPLHLSEVVNTISALGYPVQQMDYEQWRVALLEDDAQENALKPLASLLIQKTSDKPLTYLETCSLGAQALDCQNTVRGLTGTSIVCPPVDITLLNSYLAYLKRSGALEGQFTSPF
ncbi:amino acid adenylation domain-containing protein [Leptolyngbya sp. FACHB-261]|uniref:amino acid adenylation domain-containing protein n=1 Tax=Leptolyngbya sp. FACHB-261 TaxID=2692806 RepID=UPI001688FF5C|nr:amino acid adenylation domain-containing protein [Leptolyngbya sp. FACHB-261]MBD2102484.1 amino acid adenylation domain-containing protein [Leptolyngbya sp. FACHB-261]